MYRQALYACATCSGVDDGGGAGRQQSQSEPGGVCLACSLHCHDGHTLYELYTKRWVLACYNYIIYTLSPSGTFSNVHVHVMGNGASPCGTSLNYRMLKSLD